MSFLCSILYNSSVLKQVSITACYAFFPLSEAELPALREELLNFGKERGMKGLVLLASEGINATVCGSAQTIAEWKQRITALDGSIIFKDSAANQLVFCRWLVKIKREIVQIKDHAIHPEGVHRHLTPEEWHDMQTKEDVILLDARNNYEVAIGKFRGAIDPGIRRFHEFPAYLKRSKIPKNKKVMLYCTGGIRCEKALLAMEREGFHDVYQLQGGILAYLEKYPEENFEGECFVFDHRVAVDQHLQPSKKFTLCPRCGDPSATPVCTSCAVSA